MSTRAQRYKKARLRREDAQKPTIHQEMYARLQGMLQAGMGRSRHDDKGAGIDQNYIYTTKTYEGYKAACKAFLAWCKTIHPEVQTLEDCRPLCGEWLQVQLDKGLSPATIVTRRSALVKLFHLTQEERGQLPTVPPRTRAGITRSRGPAVRDRDLSPATEARYAAITACTGLRRAELLHLRGTDLVQDSSGRWWLHITRGTKGGKPRTALIIGTTKEITHVVDLCHRAGADKVCPHVPSHYDNHHYRAEYAMRAYKALARPTDQLQGHDRYVMRKDRAGEVLDRRAMRLVSQWMGHSRESVIAQNYLYDL